MVEQDVMRKLFRYLLPALLLVAILLLPLIMPVAATPVYEDFTTYTELDPNNHIDLVGTNHIDFDAYMNEDAYLYKDKGTDFFSNFEHKIDIKLISASASYAFNYPWCVANAIGAIYPDLGGSTNLLNLQIYKSPGSPGVCLTEYYGASSWVDCSIALSFGTWYYLTIKKVGTALTCKIYSDSVRTTLLDTLSLTLHADIKYRYIYAANVWNGGEDRHFDTTIENLDLQQAEVVPTITTNNATYVSRTTAQLNSYLNDDGGEACDVRFQYSTGVGGGSYVDFDDWTEVDPTGAGSASGHIQWTSYHLTHDAYDNEDCYFYTDMGAGNITNFTHQIQIEASNKDSTAHGFPWVLANVTSDTKAMKDASEPYLDIYLYANGGALEIYLVEGHSGNSYTDMYSGSYNTSYYLTIIKDGTDFSCKIYNNAERGGAPLDTLNLTLQVDHTFRYVYAANTRNDASGEHIFVTIDDLSLVGGGEWINTSWVNDTYNTGDSPYADMENLAVDTKYYFRVQARNTEGTTNGSEVNFTTYPAITEPTNFTGYPTSTTISLSWEKGAGAANTMVRGQVGDYPVNYSSGEQVYASTMATTMHSGLTPGTTYYYRSWSFDAIGYSDNYTDFLMTTTAYSAVTNDTPASPTTPSNWWGVPDYTNLENLAGYEIINTIADNFQIPPNTFWMSLILIIIMSIGLFIYSVQHNVTVAIVLMGVLIVVASIAGLLPLFMIAFVLLPAAGVMLVKRRI